MQSSITSTTLRLAEVVLELSYNCNFECTMCGFGQKAILPEHFMTAGVLERAIRSMRGRVAQIRLNGRGESTIHPEFIPMLRTLRRELDDVPLSLFTNLSCRVPVLEAIIDQHVQLYVSMDSPDAQELEAIRKGCRAEQFFRNVARLAAANPRPFIVFTLQPANVHRIRDIADCALSHDFGIIYNVVRNDAPDDELVNLVGNQRGSKHILPAWLTSITRVVQIDFDPLFSLMRLVHKLHPIGRRVAQHPNTALLLPPPQAAPRLSLRPANQIRPQGVRLNVPQDQQQMHHRIDP